MSIQEAMQVMFMVVAAFTYGAGLLLYTVGQMTVKAILIGLVKGYLGLMEGIDEALYPLLKQDFMDNPWWRGLAGALLGGAIDSALWAGRRFLGWHIGSGVMAIIVLAVALIGLIADPYKKWEVGPMPNPFKKDKPNVFWNV